MIGFGQDDDVIKLQNQINDINYKMEKHHKQHSIGTIIIGIGFVSTATSSRPYTNSIKSISSYYYYFNYFFGTDYKS